MTAAAVSKPARCMRHLRIASVSQFAKPLPPIRSSIHLRWWSVVNRWVSDLQSLAADRWWHDCLAWALSITTATIYKNSHLLRYHYDHHCKYTWRHSLAAATNDYTSGRHTDDWRPIDVVLSQVRRPLTSKWRLNVRARWLNGICQLIENFDERQAQWTSDAKITVDN